MEARAEEDSQVSCKDTASSFNDFDPDESMDSQQTDATEVTQPIRPTISQVC